MLLVLKRTISIRRFFWAHKTYVKTDGKENIANFTLKFLFILTYEDVLNVLALCIFFVINTITAMHNTSCLPLHFGSLHKKNPDWIQLRMLHMEQAYHGPYYLHAIWNKSVVKP